MGLAVQSRPIVSKVTFCLTTPDAAPTVHPEADVCNDGASFVTVGRCSGLVLRGRGSGPADVAQFGNCTLTVNQGPP